MPTGWEVYEIDISRDMVGMIVSDGTDYFVVGLSMNYLKGVQGSEDGVIMQWVQNDQFPHGLKVSGALMSYRTQSNGGASFYANIIGFQKDVDGNISRSWDITNTSWEALPLDLGHSACFKEGKLYMTEFTANPESNHLNVEIDYPGYPYFMPALALHDKGAWVWSVDSEDYETYQLRRSTIEEGIDLTVENYIQEDIFIGYGAAANFTAVSIIPASTTLTVGVPRNETIYVMRASGTANVIFLDGTACVSNFCEITTTDDLTIVIDE